MTELRGPEGRAAGTDPARGRSRAGVSVGLNAIGIVVVAFWFVRNGVAEELPLWVWLAGAVALAAWAVREYGPPRLAVPAAVVMVVAGALAVVHTDGLLLVPVIIGLVVLEAAPTLPVWVAVVAALVAVAVVAAVATAAGTSVALVLGTALGLALGVVIGVSRRQLRTAEEQTRVLEEQARQADRDQQRAGLLADRARVARDVHDVLAHSLGGLVLQLDAVEALLEAGRVDDARQRASDARTLAADGLTEARRAVRALRDDQPGDVVPAGAAGPDARDEAEPARASRPTGDGIAALVDAHRSFGGTAVVQGDLDLHDVDEPTRAVVVAGVREALSNARRHAPGRPVSLSVIRDGDAVDVVVANPVAADGHGLLGMRERFAELGGAATVEAERSDGEFVVAMHVPVARSAGRPTRGATTGRTS
ncbi:sensor histidine kinase [Curtobacterium herbarum]|uniref:histidine kinase n=1 Tax=Curtobacterium herbarum TaxID=150122 RepID=A0ABP4K4D9_9MICO|nr:histidine kinase [Curtobacterium herbarum]MBM7474014.1 signal transduction histidine kinase [Curtobacterium herbarum]MCS6544659.1 histidine kinase [Curtobacterium herbarum]